MTKMIVTPITIMSTCIRLHLSNHEGGGSSVGLEKGSCHGMKISIKVSDGRSYDWPSEAESDYTCQQEGSPSLGAERN